MTKNKLKVLYQSIGILAVSITLAACQPSCKDRGGHLEFTHYLSIWNGKFVQLVPQYKCVMPSDNE